MLLLCNSERLIDMCFYWINDSFKPPTNLTHTCIYVAVR